MDKNLNWDNRMDNSDNSGKSYRTYHTWVAPCRTSTMGVGKVFLYSVEYQHVPGWGPGWPWHLVKPPPGLMKVFPG